MDGIRGCATIFVMVHASGGYSGLGKVFIHEPLHHVDPVSEQICDLPSTEIEIGSPIPELLNVPIPPGARAEKLFPVEPSRVLGERRAAQMVAVSVPPGSCDSDLTQLSGIEILSFGLDVMSSVALLHSHLNHTIIQSGSLDDLLAFSDAERQRLFDIDVFTGVASINGNGNMPVVGGGNEDCIDILLSQQVSVFSKLLCFPSDLFLGLVQTLVIDIAERHNLNFRVLLKMSQHAATALA